MAHITQKVSLEHSRNFSQLQMWVEDEGTCSSCGATDGPFIVAAPRDPSAFLDDKVTGSVARQMGIPETSLKKLVTEENLACFPCTVDALIEVGQTVGEQMGAAKVIAQMLGRGAGVEQLVGGGVPVGARRASAQPEDESYMGQYL